MDCMETECCCKCKYQAKIRYCDCGKCDASIKTPLQFACLVPQECDRSGIYLQKDGHGLCEMFTEIAQDALKGEGA